MDGLGQTELLFALTQKSSTRNSDVFADRWPFDSRAVLLFTYTSCNKAMSQILYN